MALIHSASLAGFSLFVGANDFGGTLTAGKLPFPTRNLVDRRPAGTNMMLKTHHGWNFENFEVTVAGATEALFSIMGGRTIDARQIFFRNAFVDEWTGEAISAEIEVWGRTEENDFFGEAKAGEDTEGSFALVPVIVNCSWGGSNVYRYNARTGQVVMGAEDVSEAIRAALGRT